MPANSIPSPLARLIADEKNPPLREPGPELILLRRELEDLGACESDLDRVWNDLAHGRDDDPIRVRWSLALALWCAQWRTQWGAWARVRLGLSVAGASANLRGADLYGANLSRADLREAYLRWADLYGANLRGADLYGANLSRANLRWANLSGANLSGADLRRADLSGADLSRADLYGANLSGADLSRADLRRADLSGADLRETIR